MRPALVLFTLCIACSGSDDDGPKASGMTGVPQGDDDDNDPCGSSDATLAPVMFDDTTLATGVSCSGTTVDFAFDFLGDASEGLLDIADSANASNWNEAHTLEASGFTECGGYTLLSAGPLTIGAATIDWADGTDTVFVCDLHFDDPAVMSYIARAYDLNGNLADCVAWGHDPQGLVDGAYFTYNPTRDEADLNGCRVLASAR